MLSTEAGNKVGQRYLQSRSESPRYHCAAERVTKPQNLWDNPFQLDFSLADHVSMSGRPEVNLRLGPILAVLIHSL